MDLYPANAAGGEYVNLTGNLSLNLETPSL